MLNTLQELLQGYKRTHGLHQLIAVFAASFSRFLTSLLLGTSMAIFLGRQSTPFAVSMALAAFFLGMLICAPIWGAISDVLRKEKIVMVAAGFLATIVLVPLLVSRGVIISIVVRGFYGAAITGFTPIMISLMSESGGDQSRGKAIGFFNSSRSSGIAAGRFTGGFLVGFLAPGSVYLVLVLASLVSTILVFLVKDPHQQQTSTICWSDVLKDIKERLLIHRWDEGFLKQGGLNWLYTAVSLRHMTVKGILSLLPVYVTLELGISEPLMGVLLSINPVVQICCMHLSGWLADRIGRKPLLIFGTIASGLFALVTSLASFVAAMSMRIALIALSNAVLAVAFSALSTGASSFIGDVSSFETESQLQGVRSMSVGLGGVLGPILVGGLASVFDYQLSFMIGSILSFGATVIILFMVTETYQVGDS